MSKQLKIWDKCRLYEGSVFVMRNGETFTYTVDGSYIIPSRTDWRIPKKDIEAAYHLVPFAGPGVIRDSIQGPSYVWSIVHDKRAAGKYAPLCSFLTSAPVDQTEVTMSLKQVELVLGFLLPPTARKNTAWWANDQTHSQAKAWLAAGFNTKVTATNLRKRIVSFKRNVK